MIGEFIHGECIKGMKEYPDNHFDLAICDPPYGIGNTTTSAGNKNRKTLHKRVTWNNHIPPKEYFKELYRVSENQIIWGANYFYPHIVVPGRIIFYKKPFQDLSKGKIRFCPCDLASQSFDNRIEYFEYNWYGNTQNGKPNFDNSGPDRRIHPNQKPIALYRYCLKKFAKEGDLILDTHVGSASSLIACEDMGFKYVGYELDKDYYDDAMKRLQNHIAQLKLEYQ